MVYFILTDKQNKVGSFTIQKGKNKIEDSETKYYTLYSPENVLTHSAAKSRIHVVSATKTIRHKKDDQIVYKTKEINVLETLPLWDTKTIQRLYQLQVNIQAGNNVYAVCAARNGFLDIIKYLVEEIGISPSASHFGLIKWAVYGKHEEMIRYLVKQGADVNKSGLAALKMAVKMQDESLVMLLLSAGAETREKRFPEEALCLALELKNETIARLLLDAGARINGIHGETVITIIKMEDMKMVKFLCEYSDNQVGSYQQINLKKTRIVSMIKDIKNKQVREYLLKRI